MSNATKLLEQVSDIELRLSHEADGKHVTEEAILAALGATRGRPLVRYLLVRGFRDAGRQARRQQRADDPTTAMEAAWNEQRRVAALYTPEAIAERDEERKTLVESMDRAMAFYESVTLSSGKPLMEATRADLEAEAAALSLAATGMRRQAKRFTALAAMVPQGQTVREAVDHDQITEVLTS